MVDPKVYRVFCDLLRNPTATAKSLYDKRIDLLSSLLVVVEKAG